MRCQPLCAVSQYSHPLDHLLGEQEDVELAEWLIMTCNMDMQAMSSVWRLLAVLVVRAVFRCGSALRCLMRVILQSSNSPLLTVVLWSDEGPGTLQWLMGDYGVDPATPDAVSVE